MPAVSSKPLTVKQAAERAGISVSLLYELCAAGTIRHTRHGRPGSRGTIRISEEALAEYLKACEQGRQVAAPTAITHQTSSPASPFSELNPARLARAWRKS
jgi:excisionase family DNA binding protein